MLAPVVIFTYNRPKHTRKTIEALSKNIFAKETEIYIYSDAPKDEQSKILVNEVREYIDSLNDKKYFKNVSIEKAQTNKGLAQSVIAGVSYIVGKYGKIIVVEDDLISSLDFLQYMNGALDYYKSSNKIWSISGYTVPIKIPDYYNDDIYLSYRGCSWGWGTWKDRWEKVDWYVSDYNEFKKDFSARRKFNRGGRDMSNMLESQMNKRIDSWAIRWCYSQSKLNMYTVYPVISKINNIGLDGSGTHSGISTHYDASIKNENKKCIFTDPALDIEINRNFRNYYMTLFERFSITLKILVKRLFRW